MSVLLLYLGAPVFFTFHQADHDEYCHEHDEKTATACHNAIEHHGSKYACSDKTHISKAVHKCSADQPFNFPGFIQPFEAFIQFESELTGSVSKPVYFSSFTSRQRISFSNKGPPTLS